MSTNHFEELYLKIMNKFASKEIVHENNDIDAFTLHTALKDGMSSYHHCLVDNAQKMVKAINKKVSKSNLFQSNAQIPYIYKMCPGINDVGNKYIDIYFTNKYADRNLGKATVDEDLNVNVVSLSKDYSKEKVTSFLKDDISYEDFFDTLDAFRWLYPNISYQWNNQHENSKEKIDDGFNTIYFDLDDIDRPIVAFSNHHDSDVARTYSKKYGYLYDYIDFYKDEIMRKTKVSVDHLNPLYQSIVKRYMKHKDFSNPFDQKVKKYQ